MFALPRFIYIIPLVCLLALAVVSGWFGLGHVFNRGSDDSSVISDNLDFTISYTADGFDPSILEVPAGARVRFVNNAQVSVWPASDPHPTHSDFPEFDSRAGILPGESYTFTFTKLGTFSFHNHSKSIERGIIRVSNPGQPLPDIDKVKAGQRATRDKLLALFDQNNPDSVFTVIDAIEANVVLARDCHDMAHDIGHRAYELFGFSAAMTFNSADRLSHTSVDDICAGGYMHGILEELFLHQPERATSPGAMCAPVPTANRDSCYHGVGHSLMFVYKRDVPASLLGCRAIGEDIPTRRCFEGVWMEMFWGNIDHAGGDSLGWTTQQPLVPCERAGEDEKPTCFLYAHLGYLRTHPRDYAGAVNLCVASGLGEYDARYCLRGVGITMMKHVTSRNLPAAEPFVAGLNYGKKYAYYEGVIGYARLSGVTEKSITEFCSVLKTDTEVCTDVQKNTPR